MKKRGLIIFSSVLVLGVLVFGISSCTNKRSVANTSVNVIEVTEGETEPEETEATEPETEAPEPETEETKPEIDKEAIIEEWSSTNTSLSDLERELKSHNVNGSDINEIIETISTNREHQTQESLPAPTQAPKPTEAPTQAPTKAPETQPQTEAPTQVPVMPTAPPETEAPTEVPQTEPPTQETQDNTSKYYKDDGTPDINSIVDGLLAGDSEASQIADGIDAGDGGYGNHDWN